MTALSGMEMFNFEDRHDTDPAKFYRIIRVDATIHVTWGKRGTPGQSLVKEFESTKEAARYLTSRAAAKRLDGYVVAYSGAGKLGPGIDPTAGLHTLWDTETLAQVSGTNRAPRTTWVLCVGLLAEYGMNRASTVILDYLRAAPHAIDVGSDRVVGIVARLPTITPPFPQHGPGETYSHYPLETATHALGLWTPSCAHATLACVPCQERIAELLLFLTRGHHLGTLDRRQVRRMVTTASNLAVLGAH